MNDLLSCALYQKALIQPMQASSKVDELLVVSPPLQAERVKPVALPCRFSFNHIHSTIVSRHETLLRFSLLLFCCLAFLTTHTNFLNKLLYHEFVYARNRQVGEYYLINFFV